MLSRLAFTCLVLAVAPAWLRASYEDADVVARSELVVVAHLKPGSIQLVDHVAGPSQGASWENHATLVITSTLKGKAAASEIPITIAYGLDPLVEGKLKTAHIMVNQPGTYPPGSVQIVDTGNSACCGPPLVADATTDNVWLLRKQNGPLGIADPEDLRPLADKDYLSLYLASDPEKAVRLYAQTHTSNAGALRYVDHADIQHILAGTNPGEKVDKLLPYFLRRVSWGLKDEAGDGIVAQGADVAGPRLLTVFAKSSHGIRESIIDMWGRLGWRGAVDPLVSLLDDDNKFFGGEKLTKDWWNENIDSAQTEERRARYGETYEAVNALGKIKDKRARDALVATRALWTKLAFDNPQIVEGCTDALAHL
jgi:hypothetical protein